MKYKVEFEIEVQDITGAELVEFLEFKLGVKNSMKTKNRLSYACLQDLTKKVKITKKEVKEK